MKGGERVVGGRRWWWWWVGVVVRCGGVVVRGRRDGCGMSMEGGVGGEVVVVGGRSV